MTELESIGAVSRKREGRRVRYFVELYPSSNTSLKPLKWPTETLVIPNSVRIFQQHLNAAVEPLRNIQRRLAPFHMKLGTKRKEGAKDE